MKRQISLLSVALAVCTAAPLAAQTLTAWDSPVKVTAADGALTKTSGCEGCADAGARSSTQLTAEGYTEFTAPALARLFAGLGGDLTPSTASSTIGYAFSLWPSGVWEIRELGAYRTEGSYAAGDRFRVGVEDGAVVYRRNGSVVYTSAAAPVYPLGLDVTLYSLGASIAQASVALSAPPPERHYDPRPKPAEIIQPPASVGPYLAVVDRQVHAKPALPVLGAAGSAIADPVFSTSIRRVTDGLTRPGAIDRSYRTPSSPHQNSWSAGTKYFYVMGSGGVGPIPYAFDAATGTARRIQPSSSGDGGLVLKFYIEPQFSYVNDAVIYGSYSGSGSTLRTIDQYDFTTAIYSRLIDLDALVPGLSGTYIGGVASSGGPVERIETFFGGTSQDRHHYVVVFDRANPQNRQILDTLASTINGQPAPITLNFRLHHAMIDLSGRYVMLYSTSVDQAAPRYAAQEYLWDLQTGAITELGTAALSYGHDAFGYGVYVNKDCCTSTTWDAGQWQFRSLASPLVTRDLIKTVLTPKEVYLSDHTTWNNARPDRLTPVISGLYRFGVNPTAWRPWDDEIVAIQTDAPAGAESTVWRFAHHRSDVTDDRDATRVAFWYQPHPNVSQDGNWILFTSNWEKSLGTDSAAEPGTGARQDVFLLALRPASPPVSIGAVTLPGVRATLAYQATLGAAGGSGTYAWSVVSGALPAGLTLDGSTGHLTGIPLSAGISTFTVRAADAGDTSNVADAPFSIAIAPSPVRMTTGALASGRATVAYSGALQASGGTGAFRWTIAGGALPSGVTLDPSTGALTGAPAAAGSFAFTAVSSDAGDDSNVASQAFTLAVSAPPVVVTTPALAAGRERVAYSATVQTAGGSGGVTWSVVSGLPAGLSLNAATGTIAGTPSASGTFAVTLRATDTADPANASNVTLTLPVAAAVKIASPRTLPGAAAGVAYSYTVLAANVVGTPKWNLQGGALPPGMSLDANTGVISGTCTTKGTYSFNARVKDASTDDTLTLTLIVN